MGDNTLTDARILAQIPGARERGRVAKAVEPRASSARYSRVTGRVTVTLTNGAIFSFPARLAPGLGKASQSELSKVRVSPSGEGLFWEELDADLSVAGMLEAIMGTTRWMRVLGRSGGRSRSPAKARAARVNGAKGGRPKTAPTNRQRSTR